MPSGGGITKQRLRDTSSRLQQNLGKKRVAGPGPLASEKALEPSQMSCGAKTGLPEQDVTAPKQVGQLEEEQTAT